MLAATAIALIVSAAAAVAGTVWLRTAQSQSIASALQTRLQLAQEDLRPDGTLPTEPRGPRSDLVQVVSTEGKVLAASSALRGLGPLVDGRTVLASRGHASGTANLQSPDVDLATLAVPWTVTRGGAQTPAVLVVALDVEGFNTGRDNLTLLLVVDLVVGVTTLALLVRWVGGRTLRDVTVLARQAETTPTAELRYGLPVPQADAELEALVTALNRMLLRLHAAHSHELAFAAEAGHRIRTPLATLRAEAELALDEPDLVGRGDALRRVVDDADQLAVVVDDLLASTRARVEGAQPIDMLLDRSATDWQRQARTAGLDLAVASPAVRGRWSCPGFRDVVDPLVDNAIRHSTPSTWVLVQVALSTTASRMSATVTVSNDGPAVPPELGERLFEAWVSGGGPTRVGGLGLWTSRRTAADQGGSVELLDRKGGRTRFRVRLPMVALEPLPDVRDR